MQKFSGMKKAVGFLFILLANIVLLAHTVIPHHHNRNDVDSCNLWHHKLAGDAGKCCHFHTPQTDPGKENEPPVLSFEECLLDRIYIRFANHSHTLEPTDSDPGLALFLFYLPGRLVAIQPVDRPLPFRQKPYPQSCYSHSVARSAGRRAPPFC